MTTPKPVSQRFADQLRFLRSWVGNPLKTGAVAPSSIHLARAMASKIDPAVDGKVIELGPGTGVVTAAILERGVSPDRLVSVEYNPDFVALLAERFPGVTVVRGDAYAFAEIARQQSISKVAAVISSLPLFTEPQDKRISLVEQAFALMQPGSPFIQFSYALVSPVPKQVPDLTLELSDWVVKNVPPARVWTYRRTK